MKKINKKNNYGTKFLKTTLVVFFSSILFFIFAFCFNQINNNVVLFSSTNTNDSLNSELIVFVLMIIFGSVTVISILVLVVLLILFFVKSKSKIKVQLDSNVVDIPKEVKNV